ncbi:MAG: SlyX family protein [Planctomycetota bacterium]
MDDDIRKRVEKIEETQAFAEHTADQLSDEVRKVHDLVGLLAKRVGDLEKRLKEVEREEGVKGLPDALEDLPPHSAG